MSLATGGLLSGDTSTKSRSNCSATIRAFLSSSTPICTPSGAITSNFLERIPSFIFNSGISTPFHKKNSTKLLYNLTIVHSRWNIVRLILIITYILITYRKRLFKADAASEPLFLRSEIRAFA